MSDTTAAEALDDPQAGASADAVQAEAAVEQPVEDVGALFKAEVARREGVRDGAAPKPEPVDAAPVEKVEPEKAPQAADAKPTDAKPDPWAGVDPALKRQYDSMMQANRSLSGRVSAQERLLNELRAAQGQGPKPAKALSPEALKKTREDFPELTDLVDLVETTRQELEQTRSTVGSFADERQQRHDQEQLAHLAARHKDWAEIHRSPEFAAWKAANPAFGQIADSSSDGEELAQVFDVFKLRTGRLSPNPAPDGATTKPDAGARRAAQLETSVAVSGKAPAAPTGNGGGPDATSALWKAEVARRAAQKGARA
jgi:hypothetical protein